MDPNLRSFAVFINSNSSLDKSTAKSKCNIPFNGNLAVQDPHKLLRVALSQMKFTNSVYNITEENNTLKVCAQFAKGRGYDAASYPGTASQLNQRLWQTWTIRIPVGYYDTQTLSTTLSERGVLYPENAIGEEEYLNRVGYESVQQRFEYDVNHITFQDCFIGWGANPVDPSDPINTKGVITVDENSKVVFQTADLAHLVQYGTDINTPVTNILPPGSLDKTSNTLDYSMVYKGVHLLFDSVTRPLLETLGFFNVETIPAPRINGYCNNLGTLEEQLGYSVYFKAKTLKDEGITAPWDNITYYTFDLSVESVLTITPPSFLQTPQVVAGHIYGTVLGDLTPVLLLRDDDNEDGTDYYEAALGDFVAGTGITQPNPFLTSSLVSPSPAGTPMTLKIPALGVQNTLEVAQATWVANAGWGLQIGYPIRLVNYQTATNPANFTLPFMGYYVTDIDDSVDPVIITLNASYNSLTGPTTFAFEYKTYTLSRSQAVTSIGISTTYVAMVVSGDPISTAAAQLRPNTLSNLQGLDEIYVHCPQLRTVHFSSSARQRLAPSDVICVIPVDVVFGSKQTYQPPVILDAFLSNTNVTNLEISLTDSNNKLLDFNGVDWSMVLKCEEVDVDTSNALAQQGLFNTPFQDQLQLLEGTARQEIKAKRGRLPYEFYEASKSRKY
jgi:hypothetical protein